MDAHPVSPVTLSVAEADRFLELCEQLFPGMIHQQREKVLRLAREVVPHLSPEDVLNPHDFPQLHEHPTFEFEDGILAGLIASHLALRAEIKQRTQHHDALRR